MRKRCFSPQSTHTHTRRAFAPYRLGDHQARQSAPRHSSMPASQCADYTMRAQPRRRAEDLVGKGQEPVFLRKTFEMICACDADETDLACWTANGETFVVKNPDMFSSVVIPRFFKREFLFRLCWKGGEACCGSVIVHFSYPYLLAPACPRQTEDVPSHLLAPRWRLDQRGWEGGGGGAAHALLRV